VTLGVHIRVRVNNQGRKNLEDKENKKRSVVLRQRKRASYLKEPSHSTWEDLCCLDEDSMDRVGRDSLGLILGKPGNAGLLEACVRQNRNL
jgi:hypothetical protein